MRRIFCAVLLTSIWTGSVLGQTLTRRPAQPDSQPPTAAPVTPPVDSIALTVPPGTPLKVALDQEVRIREVGQPIHGKVVEPVYAFDRLVIPAGSEVLGKVSEIEAVPKGRRTLAAMNANFSPAHQVQVDFDELVFSDGRHLSMHTVVSPSSQGVLQFVPANEKEKTGIKNSGKNMASRKVSGVRQEIKRQWQTAKKQIHEPGKMHRLQRVAVAQLPYHPQYLDAGTSFNADLQQPLTFGEEPLKPEMLSAVGSPPPSGSVVHALLVTPLSSATSKKGDAGEAVISQPLYVSDHLFLPQGSHLKGSVLQVRPAKRLGRNGQLRIVFHQVVPPSGIEQKVEASLEGVEVSGKEHLTLDSEGGAQVTTPKTRYLTTAIAVALASSSMSSDHDHDLRGGGGGGDVGGGAANGASGFHLLGTIVGALAHSRVLTSGFGIYGASMSIYAHFLARGHDVVYPKDMSMVVGLGTRENQR